MSITLSEIKLSAFIILVFSKQKGLTLVFRNDPLESLKVSSTFDSIQFVRDYLQKTIEQQLRNLMMEELPAIIHRLSLQLWCPDQANKGTETPQEADDETGIDPLASPPLDPVDANGNLLDPNDISELTLNGSNEVQSLFSQKNLLRLAALTDSHRTLSLFTPGIRDVVFRAWTGHGDRSEAPSPSIGTPSLSKTNSFVGGANTTTYTFSDSGSTAHGHLPSRPSLVSLNSAATGLSLGSGGRSRSGRKKKTRVVNLRGTKSEAVTPENMSEVSDTASVNVPLSEPVDDSIPEEAEEGSVVVEAPIPNKVRFRSPEEARAIPLRHPLASEVNKQPQSLAEIASAMKSSNRSFESMMKAHEAATASNNSGKEKAPVRDQSVCSDTSSVILEQAWIMKMAGEIAKRVYDEKNRQQRVWDEREDAPPAYEATTQ